MVSTVQAEGVSSYFQDPPDRAALRRALRAQRRGIPPHEHRRLSAELSLAVARSALFLRARRIALFLPNDGEPDLTPLLQRAWAMGKQCYLPLLAPGPHNRLRFARYRSETALLPNRFGIPEPRIPFRLAVAPWALDLVLAPLVAFDNQGNRLGMGGGFYDRTLAYLHQQTTWQRPHLVGVAFAFQEVAQLPAAAWDVPLAGVITERGPRGPRFR